MKSEINSNEVRVTGDKLYSDSQKIGYVFGNEECESNGIYTIKGLEVYRKEKKVGYACNGYVRLKDGTLWQYL